MLAMAVVVCVSLLADGPSCTTRALFARPPPDDVDDTQQCSHAWRARLGVPHALWSCRGDGRLRGSVPHDVP